MVIKKPNSVINCASCTKIKTCNPGSSEHVQTVESAQFLHSFSIDTGLYIPYRLLSFSNFSGPMPLVNASASMSSVGQILLYYFRFS